MRNAIAIASALAALLGAAGARADCGSEDGSDDCTGKDLHGKTCADFANGDGVQFKSGRLACSSSCTFDKSKCSTSAGAMCGDGVLDAGELCDFKRPDQCACCDTCDDFNFSTQCRLPQCGDGCVERLEECDEGTSNSDVAKDACRTDCTPPRCGDGAVDTGETCDEGPKNSDFMPDACRAGCTLPFCGDGVVDTRHHELCDLGAANSDELGAQCSKTCQTRYCGNGNVEAGETCDDGADNGPTKACTPMCQPAVCGDGFVASWEQCDGEDCTYDCRQDLLQCGDAVADPGEECDLGAANSAAQGATCRTDCRLARCGDGVVDSGSPRGEACDRAPDCGPGCLVR